MYRDIGLFYATGFAGWYPLEVIDDTFAEYSQKAEELAAMIDWDECVVYAIYSYYGEKQTILSADFMLLRMPYRKYLKLYSELSKDCRIFFIRNR